MPKTYITKRAQERELEEVDARKPLAIEVTARDIKLAKARNSKDCALARAVKRAMPVKAAFFLRGTAFLEYADKMVRYRIPSSVQKEIRRFDSKDKTMAVGEYVLSPVTPDRAREPRVRVRQKQTSKKIKERSARAKKASRTAYAHTLQGVRTQFEPKDDGES